MVREASSLARQTTEEARKMGARRRVWNLKKQPEGGRGKSFQMAAYELPKTIFRAFPKGHCG